MNCSSQCRKGAPAGGPAPLRLGGLRNSRPARRGGVAFTLLELLVVIAIIGVLASSSVPTIRSLVQSNTVAAGYRQVIDDLALARHLAISRRQTVYMVFVPPSMRKHFQTIDGDPVLSSQNKQRLKSSLTNLVKYQYTGYALFARRTVGDQPGRRTPAYLISWKNLPDGVFIRTNKFQDLPAKTWADQTNSFLRPFAYAEFPFPSGGSVPLRLPYVAFNARGELSFEGGVMPRGEVNEVIPLERGSVFYAKNIKGDYLLSLPPDVVRTSETNTIVRVNWLTGRAKVEGMQIHN